MTSAQEFALEAARKYLQSVVFVDDEIYVPLPTPTPDLEVTVPGTAMRVFAPPKILEDVTPVEPQQALSATSSNTFGSFHPKALVESFARERMVCALYEPGKDFPTGPDSEIFKLCERADVVILDWEFHKEPGKKVLQLIKGLVASAQTSVPHHVRLCVIYTTTQNLKHIAQEIFEHLKNNNLSAEADGEYNLTAGSTRIVVLGKPSTGRPADQIEAAEVAEDLLAERVISEFAAMHSGILPSMALYGLASVRTNSKKILDKFQRDVDGAFLIHRGLILPDDDAFEQIPELLAEEALAVMIDDGVSPDKAKRLADSVIDKLNIKTSLKGKNGEEPEPGKHAVTLLKEGPSKLERKKVDLGPDMLSTLHGELDRQNGATKERLAALYACRTQYGPMRSLEFGTVVRYEEPGKGDITESQYAVCLMPLCDCVRLKEGQHYKFPFWNLRKEIAGGSSKGIAVELPGGESFIELFSLGKPRDHLWLDDFEAGKTKKVLAKKEASAFVFQGKTRKVEWVAQLKPSHAQRIAHDIGVSFSRVGVLEAEWLRRKAERQR